MKRKLKKWSIIGVFVVFVLAAGWHFLYDLLPCGFIAGIAPVNESPWEHAKLFFMPAIIWYVIMYFIVGKEFPNYIFSHAVALLFMPVFMLLLFYAYQTLLEETLPLDIANSFITIALGQFLAYKLTTSKLKLSGPGYNTAAMAIILGMLAVYIVFTFNPPHCDLFLNKTTM